MAEEISGIFIKSIAPDSVAERSKKIQINDQIIEVDGHSLYGYNNLQAVELLRSTSKVVKLKLARYNKGSKYEQINQGVMNSELNPPKVHQNNRAGSTVIQINSSFNSAKTNTPESVATSSYIGSLSAHKSQKELIEKWSPIVGPDFNIIVCFQIKKLFLVFAKFH